MRHIVNMITPSIPIRQCLLGPENVVIRCPVIAIAVVQTIDHMGEPESEEIELLALETEHSDLPHNGLIDFRGFSFYLGMEVGGEHKTFEEEIYAFHHPVQETQQ